MANAISSLLTRSVEFAKNSKGGYVPDEFITHAQLHYVSPYAISNLWGLGGYRFILTKKINNDSRELVATVLISNSRKNLFFFTKQYSNIHIDQLQKIVENNEDWFTNFSFPNINNYHPDGYNQMANFSVDLRYRGQEIGKMMLHLITNYYSSQFINNHNSQIIHSQPLVCGNGLFQISDPAWLPRMLKLGFKLRAGAETFYVENSDNKIKKSQVNGNLVNNVTYNNAVGLNMYFNDKYKQYIDNSNLDLFDELDRVKKMSKSDHAKLQYYQTYRNFMSMDPQYLSKE